MIYLQPITFYAIMRSLPDPDRTEIAEHSDGAMKAYHEKSKAYDALQKMPTGQDWRVDQILMVPPPMVRPPSPTFTAHFPAPIAPTVEPNDSKGDF